MNEVLQNIYSRRSVRAYEDKPVAEDDIMDIIKAGTQAPNGMNVQGLRFAVVTSRERMLRYSTLAKELFVKTLRAGPQNERTEQMIKSLSNPEFDIFYGAPALIVVFAHPKALTPVEDGALAAENMMLAARSMGLGSCWIGFAKSLQASHEFLREVKAPTNHQLIAPLIFGYPREDGRPAPKEEPQVLSWIR